LEDTRTRLSALESTAKSEQERLKTQNAGLVSKNEALAANLQTTKKELAALQAKLDPKAAVKDRAAAEAGGSNIWWWILGGLLAAIALMAGVWWVGGQKSGDVPQENPTANQTQ